MTNTQIKKELSKAVNILDNIMRKQRIDELGAFGMLSEKVVKDKKKYSRKIKHREDYNA